MACKRVCQSVAKSGRNFVHVKNKVVSLTDKRLFPIKSRSVFLVRCAVLRGISAYAFCGKPPFLTVGLPCSASQGPPQYIYEFLRTSCALMLLSQRVRHRMQGSQKTSVRQRRHQPTEHKTTLTSLAHLDHPTSCALLETRCCQFVMIKPRSVVTIKNSTSQPSSQPKRRK